MQSFTSAHECREEADLEQSISASSPRVGPRGTSPEHGLRHLLLVRAPAGARRRRCGSALRRPASRGTRPSAAAALPVVAGLRRTSPSWAALLGAALPAAPTSAWTHAFSSAHQSLRSGIERLSHGVQLELRVRSWRRATHTNTVHASSTWKHLETKAVDSRRFTATARARLARCCR